MENFINIDEHEAELLAELLWQRICVVSDRLLLVDRDSFDLLIADLKEVEGLYEKIVIRFGESHGTV